MSNLLPGPCRSAKPERSRLGLLPEPLGCWTPWGNLGGNHAGYRCQSQNADQSDSGCPVSSSNEIYSGWPSIQDHLMQLIQSLMEVDRQWKAQELISVS